MDISSRKILLLLNGLVLTLFAMGIVLENWLGSPFLRSLFAVILLGFLPGFNLAFAVLGGARLLTFLDYIVFALLTSLHVSTFFFFSLNELWDGSLSENRAILSTIIVVAVTLMTGLLRPVTLRLPSRTQLEPLLLALACYGGILGLIFWIYPFIPEADPYNFLNLARKTVETGEYPAFSYRPLFTYLTSTIHWLTHLSLPTIFKYVLPLMLTSTALPIYLAMRQKTTNHRWLIVATLLPLTAPVVALEMVVTRPQTIVLLALPGLLYLLGRALMIRSYLLWATLTATALTASLFHPFGLYLVIPAFLSGLVLVYPDLKRSPRRTLTMAGFALTVTSLALVALYPYVRTPVDGFLADLLDHLRLDWSQLQFRLWFLSDYTNIDDQPVGWPGLSSILYYGYNLGLVLPAVIAYGLWSRSWSKLKYYSAVPAVLTIVILLVVAEVLPRLGLYFLPDRVWPFFVLALTVSVPFFITTKKSWRSAQLTVLGVIFFVSIASNFYVAFAKQGWVTKDEFKAVLYLRNQTPVQSLVVSQKTNWPLVTIYANRQFNDSDIFTPARLPQERLQLLKSMRPASSDLPLFVLYSTDKFNSLYAQRQWWRQFNYADADLGFFDDTQSFELVFSNKHVKIWRVKISS